MVLLERESRDQRPRARKLVQLPYDRVLRIRRRDLGTGQRLVDDSKASAVLTSRVMAEGRRRGRRDGVADLRTVEDVHELAAELQSIPLLETERAAEVHVLLRTARGAEVDIVGSRRRTEGPIGGVGPGSGIQDLIEIRVDAAAIQVLEEQRLPWNPKLLAAADVVGVGRRRRS